MTSHMPTTVCGLLLEEKKPKISIFMACELLRFTVHATLWVCITWNSSSNCRVHAAAVLHFNATGLATQTGPCSLTYKECFFSQWIPVDDVAPQRDDRADVLSFKVP